MKGLRCYLFVLLFALCDIYYIHAQNGLVTTRTVKLNNYNKTRLVKEYTCYIIESVIDLKGETVYLPYKSELLFRGKGKLKNGVLVGNESTVVGVGRHFLGVIIYGTWNQSIINDRIFDRALLSDDQIMVNIENLQSGTVYNSIILNEPEYIVSIRDKNGYALSLKSHALLENNTTVRLKPNSYSHYSIIEVKDVNDITIKGGRLIGDIEHHRFKENQPATWGHGVNVCASDSVIIKDLIVENCIGDGIAITGRREEKLGEYFNASRHITVNGVKMNNNRRQGMSIIHAENVTIEDCTFSNTGHYLSTPPSAGLDIEPNSKNDYYQGVRNVSVTNCTAFGNKGSQIKVQGHSINENVRSVENIKIDNCRAEGGIDVASDGVLVKNCYMASSEVRGSKDIINKIEFDDCIWENGYGVMAYYSGYKDSIGNRVGGLIDSLVICRGKIHIAEYQSDRYYKGAVSYHGGEGGVNHLLCVDSEIIIPSSAGTHYNLTKSNNIPDMRFINCDIIMPGRELITRGATFENCRIICKSLDLQKRINEFNEHYTNCSVYHE